METKIVTINLDARAYDIFIGHSLLFRIGDFIPQNLEGRNVFIVTDKNVEPYAARVRSLIADSGTGICDLKVLPAGEKLNLSNMLRRFAPGCSLVAPIVIRWYWPLAAA